MQRKAVITALIEHTLFGKVNKVQQAIDRIRAFEPVSSSLFDKPYYVAYSGGKDSDTIRILCELAGVPYELVHNHTTIDAPETIRYIRSIPGVRFSYPKHSMWQLIEKKGIPPTRMKRYCCHYLKEGGGRDRFVMTGVRWAESSRRKASRGSLEVMGKSIASALILNADNVDNRRMFEVCQKKGKRILNPIVDWSDSDVWEFLSLHGCASNPLYQEGFTRIGCVGCPMAGWRREIEFARWPKYRDNYVRAFQRMVDKHGYADTTDNWQDGESVFRWWMQDKNMHQIDGQLSFLLNAEME